MNELTGKVALITGAGSGIGQGIAKNFAQYGATIGVADINIDAAEQTVSHLIKQGVRAFPIEMDVTDEQTVNTGVDGLVEKTGRLDILISNAGVQTIGAIETLTLDQWQRMLAIHLDGAFLTTKAALKQMYQQPEGGKVIYMGSVHSHEASLYKAPYVTAKHGLLGLARTLAKEGGEKNVHSHVVCPGFVKTPLVEKQIPEQATLKGISEESVVRDIMLSQTVDKTFTTIEDIANLTRFLATHPTGAFTGQSFNAGHGWGMR